MIGYAARVRRVKHIDREEGRERTFIHMSKSEFQALLDEVGTIAFRTHEEMGKDGVPGYLYHEGCYIASDDRLSSRTWMVHDEPML